MLKITSKNINSNRVYGEPNTAYQISVFLATIGGEVYDTYDSLKFERGEDKIKLGIVIKN